MHNDFDEFLKLLNCHKDRYPYFDYRRGVVRNMGKSQEGIFRETKDSYFKYLKSFELEGDPEPK